MGTIPQARPSWAGGPTLPAAAPAGSGTPAPPPALLASYPRWDQDPTRRIGMVVLIAFVFVRFGYLSEGIMAYAGIPTYLAYITSIPAILCLIMSGGLTRAFQHRSAMMILAFTGWMALAIPTSHWPGGSFDRVFSYVRTELLMLFIIVGFISTWKDIRALFTAIAWAGLIIIVYTRILGKLDQGGRLSLDFSGSISNANDLASVMLLSLPMFALQVVQPRRFITTRLLFAGAILYGLYVITNTASRGALLSLAAGFIILLWHASAGQKVLAMLVVPLVMFGALVFLPNTAVTRLASLFGEQHIEAEESGASRKYLFEQSLIFTVQHPVFGVGPDQFPNYEGKTRLDEGQRGNWHHTHCSWTQVSSECGLPALFFYASAIFITFRLTGQAHRLARQHGLAELAQGSLMFLLSITMYFTSITFLSNAYSFRQPAVVAIGIVLMLIVQRAVNEKTAMAHARHAGQLA